MLKEEFKEIKRLTDKVALGKEAVIISIKRSLPQIGTYMPLDFCLDFRGYPNVVIDNMGINAHDKDCGDCDIPPIIVEWEALTVDEIYSLYEKINYCYYNAIIALQKQIDNLNKVEEYFEL